MNNKINWTKALRKQRICREVYGSDFYDNLHQYHNNKIHCSCPKCRGERNSNSFADQSLQTQKKIIIMEEKINEFYEEK